MPIAGAGIERHLGIDARHDLQQRAHRIDDLALRFGAAASKFDHIVVGAFGADGAGFFQPMHAFDHQGSDREESENDQARADAEHRLTRRRCFFGFWVAVRHSALPRPGLVSYKRPVKRS
ncbi:MAG: hypothetical protein WBE71_10910 [Xanthobacteraceae bacterium]